MHVKGSISMVFDTNILVSGADSRCQDIIENGNCSGQDEAFTAESVRTCSGCKNRAILNATHCPIHRNYEGTE